MTNSTIKKIKAKNQQAAMQSPEMQRAKLQLQVMIQKAGVDPHDIVYAGKLAESALKDPSKTQEVFKIAIDKGLVDPKHLVPGHEKGTLALAATAGKLAQMIIDEHKK